MPLPRRRSRTSCKPSLKVRENLEWEQELKSSTKKAVKTSQRKKSTSKNRKDGQTARSTSPESGPDNGRSASSNHGSGTKDPLRGSTRHKRSNGELDETALEDANEQHDVVLSADFNGKLGSTSSTAYPSLDSRRSKRLAEEQAWRSPKKPFQDADAAQPSHQPSPPIDGGQPPVNACVVSVRPLTSSSNRSPRKCPAVMRDRSCPVI